MYLTSYKVVGDQGCGYVGCKYSLQPVVASKSLSMARNWTLWITSICHQSDLEPGIAENAVWLVHVRRPCTIAQTRKALWGRLWGQICEKVPSTPLEALSHRRLDWSTASRARESGSEEPDSRTPMQAVARRRLFVEHHAALRGGVQVPGLGRRRGKAGMTVGIADHWI